MLVGEKARAAIRDFLDIEEGDPLPASSVRDLSVLAQWVEQTLRTAVLDRRLAMHTWPRSPRPCSSAPRPRASGSWPPDTLAAKGK